MIYPQATKMSNSNIIKSTAAIALATMIRGVVGFGPPQSTSISTSNGAASSLGPPAYPMATSPNTTSSFQMTSITSTHAGIDDRSVKAGLASPASFQDKATTIVLRNAEVDWTVNAPFDTVVDVATKSFAGSKHTSPEPSIDWALRDFVPSDRDDPDRKEVFQFALEYMVRDAIKKEGIIFGHNVTSIDTLGCQSDPSRPMLGSAAIIVEQDPKAEASKVTNILTNCKEIMEDLFAFGVAGIRGQLPRLFYKTSSMLAFLDAVVNLQDELKRMHKAYGPQQKHLFVQVVAMDPDFQGRGYGKQIMNQINDIADTLGMPLYLECAGEKNPRFYEKFGYHIVHESVFGSKDDSFVICHMTREPKRA